MKIPKSWVLGPALILGLNAPGLAPMGCSSEDIQKDPKFVRAKELMADGLEEPERAEFEALVDALEGEKAARDEELRARFRGIEDGALPFVPSPLAPLTKPVGELGLMVWFLLSDRKNRVALSELKKALVR